LITWGIFRTVHFLTNLHESCIMPLNTPKKVAIKKTLKTLEPSIKSIKSGVGAVDAVAYIKISKFKSMLQRSLNSSASAEDDITTFVQRLFALESVLTSCDDVHKIWLNLGPKILKKGGDEKAVLLVLKQTLEYEANAIPVEALRNEFSCKTDKFYILNIFCDENSCRPNLQLRVSEDGLVGEINWIERSTAVTGSDLFEIFDMISDFLRIENVILRDAAQDSEKLPLRVLRPLIKADGQTWYQTKEFEIYDCDSIKVLDEGRVFHQNKGMFRNAVSKLRRFKISSLLSLFFTNKAKARCEKILKCSVAPEDKENLENIELSVLLSNVFEKSISGKRGSKTAKNDLKFLYTNLLNPKWQRGKAPKFEKACATLHNTELFIKRR